jgi:hypothetical protein
MATNWQYCILTRLSAGLDTKWHVNRVFQHHEHELPTEVTEPAFRKYNEKFDKLHAEKKYPLIPTVLNLLGADGWELIDDMDIGNATGDEALVFKRQVTAAAAAKAPAKRAKKAKR